VRIRPVFAWYDAWIGAYWDRHSRTLYVLPLPCLGVAVQFGSAPVEYVVGAERGIDEYFRSVARINDHFAQTLREFRAENVKPPTSPTGGPRRGRAQLRGTAEEEVK